MSANEIQKIVTSSTREEVAAIAEQWQEAGEIAAATDLLEVAAGSMQHAGLWHNVGIAKAEAEDHVGAITAFTNAIDAGYSSFADRGLCYEHLEDWDAARADYLTALSTDAKDVDALINLGTMELSLGHVGEGAIRLTAAASLDRSANWQLADAYFARGDRKRGKAALWAAIEAGERRAYLDLARAEIGVASQPLIEEYFEAAIEAGSTLARRELIIFLDNEGETDRAVKIAQSGVELGDTNCFAPLAVMYESQGERDLAIDFYRLAVADGEEVYEEDLAKLLAERNPRPRR
jgi:tetratricopeptide (TPR) repeat protein